MSQQANQLRNFAASQARTHILMDKRGTEVPLSTRNSNNVQINKTYTLARKRTHQSVFTYKRTHTYMQLFMHVGGPRHV